MSVTDVLDVRTILETPLTDDAVQDVIDREEAWLARRVGPLTGERTLTVLNPDRYAPLVLPRLTDAVAVTDFGSSVTTTLTDGRYLTRGTLLLPVAWIGPVAITYTPTDETEVRGVVIELVRLAVSRTPFDSESIGDYSYSRGSSGAPSRGALARSLLPSLSVPYTLRVHA